MTFRTEQDKINRREANRRYYKLEENKQQKRDYMKEYSKREYVKAKKQKYYIQNKIRWYEDKPAQLYPAHEEWARDNGYRDNDTLNSKNSVSFKDGAER